ncbi:MULTISPECIES: transposase [unclassified Ensifer]|uniref:IS66 family transposase n=1 Tax=unclassified Ensifer TaxID=2633371 RepID=UPI000A9DD5AA|nr:MULTISPECIES: transposase [unclassified Ensifer]
MPATPRQARKVETVRDLVWRFYRTLKSVRRKAPPGLAAAFHKRFARIFSLRTGYQELDKLLARLCRRKDELLKVLDRPGIPLHTNASENDLHSFVTKRKISGGTMSRDGRVARDTMLGLMKTCRKLPVVLALSRRSDRSGRPSHSAAGHTCRDQSLAAPPLPYDRASRTSSAHGMIHIATRFAHQCGTANQSAPVTSAWRFN